jgi:pyruvate/2-oxoacid:ferredoxin oxidoreductase alpha subunit
VRHRSVQHKTFGEWLRHRRLALAISPFVMADALGYKRVSAIYNFEYGVAPLPIPKWPLMAQLLDLTLEEFLEVMEQFAPHKVSEFRAIQQSGGRNGHSAATTAREDTQLVPRTMTALLSHEEALDRYRLSDADVVLVSAAVATESLIAVVDWLRTEKDWKVGFLRALDAERLPAPAIVESLKSARLICVLEPAEVEGVGLAAQIKAAFVDALTEAEGYPRVHYVPVISDVRLSPGSRPLRGEDGYQILRQLQSDRGRRYFDFSAATVAKSR